MRVWRGWGLEKNYGAPSSGSAIPTPSCHSFLESKESRMVGKWVFTKGTLSRHEQNQTLTLGHQKKSLKSLGSLAGVSWMPIVGDAAVMAVSASLEKMLGQMRSARRGLVSRNTHLSRLSRLLASPGLPASILAPYKPCSACSQREHLEKANQITSPEGLPAHSESNSKSLPWPSSLSRASSERGPPGPRILSHCRLQTQGAYGRK